MKKYYIESIHTVYEDDYNEGEKDYKNEFRCDGIYDTPDHKEAINLHLSNIGFNLGVENCEYSDGEYQTSCLVDGNNIQPTQSEVDMWERGKLKLYSNNINIVVFELNQIFENESN